MIGQSKPGAPAPLLVPPGAFYFRGDDDLRIVSFNSASGVVLAGTGRMMTPDGAIVPFDFRHTPNTDRTANASMHAIGEGWLLHLTLIVASGTPTFGQTWASVQLVRGRTGNVTVLGELASGFVGTTQRLSWPGGTLGSTLEGPGRIRSITGTDPAAGVEISDTVPTGARWKLFAWRATLVTDATAANRLPALVIDDGTTEIYRAVSTTNHTASLTWAYNAAIAGAAAAQSASNVGLILPASLVLLAGYRIRTVTAAIVAGDNWGAPQLLVEESLEG